LRLGDPALHVRLEVAALLRRQQAAYRQTNRGSGRPAHHELQQPTKGTHRIAPVWGHHPGNTYRRKILRNTSNVTANAAPNTPADTASNAMFTSPPASTLPPNRKVLFTSPFAFRSPDARIPIPP